MDSTEDPDYPQIIFQYSNGFLVSKVMFTACELGVFDLLLESGRPLSLDVIAASLGTSIMGMERLLDACVGLKLLAVELRGEGAFYRNTEISNIYLTKSSPKSQYHIMMYYSNTVYLCWHYLADAVREGRNQYERAFGISSKDLFGAMYRSEEEMLKFLAGQNSIWSICGRDVLTAFDLSPFTRIYDLGGDFFKDSIPEADLYILSKILHDWDDEKCRQLLAEVYQACRPGGGVLLVESLLSEDRSGPVETQLYSLNMLVQTEGKERTAAEYSELLGAAGFREVQVRRTGKLYDAVLGRK
ncbi:acetylserotonin O-methyltransferase isoform X2 [Excalfactoria chinensis]|uniref:acetylserotonin O-methyltransferase isoform X2 n=1 Tax=Excalfactoria chinensis TaxID=46218 RepID=UPI003B3B02D8